MNKKNLKKVAAIILGLALTVGATGCDFVVTDSTRDLERTVATVDISAALRADEEKYGDNAGEIADAVSEIVGKAEISKRDLVTYFLSSGSSSYVETYGYKYTFNMLLDTLINRKIIIQYAIAEYLADEDANLSSAGLKVYVDAQLEEEKDEKAKALLKAHPEVLTFKYFLTEGGKDNEAYDRAIYSLKKSLNDSLDSLETQYIKASTHDHGDTSEARTLPTGVGSTKTDYYTTDYDIYTGRNDLSACGKYEKQDGSTALSRRKAYNSLLANLNSYGLISTKGGKVENPTYIQHMDYYYVELSSALAQSLINKYYEDLEAKTEKQMSESYVLAKYNEELATQTLAYENKATEFKAAMDSASDSSFVLYGMENFGYVYNILVPFSAEQEIEYNIYKAQGLTTNDLYLKRKELWSEIKAEDQRSSWISDDEHLNYSYQIGDKYYFFENHFDETKSEQYEKLGQYAGKYAFQGEVIRDADGDIDKINTKTDKNVDAVLEDMLALIKDVSNLDYTENTDVKTAYENMTTYTTDVKKDVYGNVVQDENGDDVYVDDDVVEDYSKFIYRSGKVNFTATPKADDFFNPTSESYKALSAVNEMMFAYSTDTGCLNTYMGYVVSPYGNGYVSEFEAAAQWAVEKGVGSWAVVPTDYGWHIVYCSFKYEGGIVYDYNHLHAVGDEAQGIEPIEGSFSKMYYDYLKDQMVSTTTTEMQAKVLNQFNNSNAVKKYKKAYKDLLEM